MQILIINVGSTTLKYDVYEMDTEVCLARGVVDRLDSPAALDAALIQLCDRLGSQLAGLAAVGHRVVHGGERLTRPIRIDIAEPHARTRVLVVHAEEERMIAREVVRCLAGLAAARIAVAQVRRADATRNHRG